MRATLTRRELARMMTVMAGSALTLGGRTPAFAQTAATEGEAENGAPRPDRPVYVVLWFDTEDYVLPASDDAAKRIAEFLIGLGIRATFKVVGEKARVLEQRRRSDVIAALSRHEIGYHSNTHSQQPTVAEYESVLNWQQGAEEFDRRERPGFDDLTRIFGYAPTCYGQPGVSWAPQVFATLSNWGVHVYLDDGLQVGLNGKPFWYGGLLNIFGIRAGRTLEPNDDFSNLEIAKANFLSLHAELSSQPGGGLVSFMFHPTQLISQEFWDAVNFAGGANPPRAEWKLQPQRTAADRERAFNYLEGLVRYIRSFPNVQFLTASQAWSLYRDRSRLREFDAEELVAIARQVSPLIDFQTRADYALAPSEIFLLLNTFVCQTLDGSSRAAIRLGDTPFGPTSSVYGAALSDSGEVPWSQFSRTALDIQCYLEKNRSIPNVVWLGSSAVSPESWLLALASVATGIAQNAPPPNSVRIAAAQLATGRFVAEDSASVWDWPIFPSGFHSAHLMELARLQAWTLKPALLPG